LGTYRNVDPGTFKVQYSQGSSNWGSGTLLSDATKANETDDPGQPGNWGASWWKVDGQMRWERSEDWAVDTVNGVSGKHWLRFQYSEDMSSDHPTEDDVDINEISIIQDIPTATALADWLAYTDAASETPISGLGWSFEATHTATENTVFLILRDVSAFEALTLIGEQTGENFRLGAGREIEWLQDDKVASGIRATNVPSGIAARDNAAICLITQLQETEDSYEVGSRVYPKGGGRGVMRITLAQCTDSAPAGYTLNKTANYLKKDSVEEAAPTGYGRRIEMTKFWPTVVSPSWASSRDTNSSNALLKLAYEHLSRHWEPQKSYQFSVVKLDTEIKVGQTIQLHYWQAVDGVAVWDLGVSAALHLWVLEITHAVDDAGARIVAMQVATIDAWPASDASKVTSLVSQVKSLQSTDGPISAENLTLQTIVNQFTGATSHGQLTGVTADQHHIGFIGLNGDSGSAVPDASDILTIVGGTLISTSGASSALTVRLASGSAQYQVPVTGADPFTPAWTTLSTYAGAGLAWSTNAYAVGAGNGIAVAADSIAVDLVAAWSGLEFSGADLRINLAAAFTWTAKHIFRSTTTPQVEIGYDAAACLRITQADGGSVTLATVSDGAGSMILAPQGDVLFDPTGNDLLPVTGYDLNIGSLAKKYLTLHCAELWVETLVAQDTIATIGGRILVGPTTVLINDINTTQTTITVKHNEWRRYDTPYLEAAGKVEFLLVAYTSPISGVDVAADWFKVTGNHTSYYTAGVKFTIDGSTGNNGEWTVISSSYSAPDTTINVEEDVTNATVDGWVLYRGAQGGESFIYTVNRNRDGSGGNEWYAGDAVFNMGNVGDGFIDLYSVHGVKSGTQYGPTIVGNVRNSTTFNDWSEHWAIGQLNGLYGYAATTYGLGLGKYSATSAYMTIDPTNGIRFYGNNVIMGQWQPGGDVIFGQVATNKANLFWDQSEGKLNFRGGANGTVVGAYVDTTGAIMAGAGVDRLDANGISITQPAPGNGWVLLAPVEIKWIYGGNKFGGIWGRGDVAPGSLMTMRAYQGDPWPYAYVDVGTGDGTARVVLKALPSNGVSTTLTLTAAAGVVITKDGAGSANFTLAGGLNVGTTGAPAGSVYMKGTTPYVQTEWSANTGYGGLLLVENGTAHSVFQGIGTNFSVAARRNALEINAVIDNAGWIAFRTVTATVETERVRISNAGNVGIGCTPAQRLDVGENIAGFAAAFRNVGDNANRNGIAVICGAYAGGGGASAATFFDGDGGVCGYIHIANQNVTLDNPSDERLKRDIVDTASVMDRLRAVQVRDFTMERSGGRLTGFVAQELMQPFPELVGYDEMSGMYYNRPMLMTPILVKAVQEVDAEVMAIKAEIAKLQEQLDKMERRG